MSTPCFQHDSYQRGCGDCRDMNGDDEPTPAVATDAQVRLKARYHVEGQTSTVGARWLIWDNVEGHFARYRNIADEGDARAICERLNELSRTPDAQPSSTDEDGLILLMLAELHANVPEADRPMSMSDLSDEQIERARKAVRRVLVASMLSKPDGNFASIGELERHISSTEGEVERLQQRIVELEAQLNTPEVDDFAKGAVLEAAHQRERWGASHDAGKTPFDWFWLVGYLSQKAASSAVAGDTEKAKHHTISTAAALANWHLALSGADTRMRPGIGPGNGGEKPGCAHDLAAKLDNTAAIAAQVTKP